MRKYILFLIAGLITFGTLISSSCKKVIHSNAPTPNNVRLLSYTKITTLTTNVPISLPSAKITESFRFYYDDINRVRQIIYTGNDSFEINKRIDFTYFSDTTVKSITDILTGMVVERDTFIRNADGYITTAYFPGIGKSGIRYNFDYYGKLLTRVKATATDWNHITMNSQVTYTSVNGDLLKQYPEGKLNTEFSNLTPGLDIDWLNSWMGLYTHIEDLETSEYTFQPYNYKIPFDLYVQDTLQDTAHLTYPSWGWVGESYHFYTEDAIRTGDYMQLESFTRYGDNIFRNNHLVESISASDKNAYIHYVIDAQSKITQMTVDVKDSVLNKYTLTYDLQYEEY